MVLVALRGDVGVDACNGSESFFEETSNDY